MGLYCSSANVQIRSTDEKQFYLRNGYCIWQDRKLCSVLQIVEQQESLTQDSRNRKLFCWPFCCVLCSNFYKERRTNFFWVKKELSFAFLTFSKNIFCKIDYIVCALWKDKRYRVSQQEYEIQVLGNNWQKSLHLLWASAFLHYL